jgi:hypothetical protein
MDFHASAAPTCDTNKCPVMPENAGVGGGDVHK